MRTPHVPGSPSLCLAPGLILLLAILATVLPQPAFSSQTAAATDYQRARQRHQALLKSATSGPEDFRSASATYVELVRRDPTDRYAADALWQAADVAKEAYRRFGDDRDRQSARALLRRLSLEYPNSWLAPTAAAELRKLPAREPAPAVASGAAAAAVNSAPAPQSQRLPDSKLPAYVRDAVARPDEIARLDPGNSYAAEVLWKAAEQARDRFRRSGDDRDRLSALQLFGRVKDEYPGNWLAPTAAAELTRLAASAPRMGQPLTPVRGIVPVSNPGRPRLAAAAPSVAASVTARPRIAEPAATVEVVPPPRTRGAEPVPRPETGTHAASAIRWDPLDVAGWQSFRLPKPSLSGGPQTQFASDGLTRTPRLPLQRDVLRTEVGVGHVWGQDWGMELGAGGRFRGIETEIGSFLTAGDGGIEAPMARVALRDPDESWGTEAGDLATELRGLARGVRFSWKRSATGRPAISLYLPSTRLHDSSRILAYRDEFRLLPHFTVGGEAATDQSYSARAAYVHGPVDLQSSYRDIRGDDPALDAAVMGSLRLWAGVTVQAGARSFETPTDRGQVRLRALRIPFGGLFDLTFEENRTKSLNTNGISNAVMFQLRRGPVRLMHRYQWGDAEYLLVGGPFGLEQRQLQSAGSFSPASWATFTLQASTQWLPDGRAQQWQEVQLGLNLTRRTTLQLYGPFPQFVDEQRFRGRLLQQLPKDFSLVVDFGRVSAFQSSLNPATEAPRISVMLRKRFSIFSPARGAEVRGVVTDDLGNAVPGAGVKLGPYLAFTDDRGQYAFPRVPDGEFQLAVDPAFLPAAYASSGTMHRLTVERNDRQTINLSAIPLNSIYGHVYHDVNGNGRFDAGEGRGKVVVHLDDQVTGTDADGAYGFYNLGPGKYMLTLDTERLEPGYVSSSGAQLVVDLVPGRPVTGADFRIAPRQRPVILRESPR